MSKKLKKKIKESFLPSIWILVIFSFIVRLLLSFSPSFDVDMGAWIAWAYRLDELGLAAFYSPDVWTQYTPGFLYILWLLGKLGIANPLTIKIVILLFDLLLGYLLYKFAKRRSESLGKALFLLYVLNLATIFIGSVWGQIDGILSLFMLLSVYYLVEKSNLTKSGFFWAIALLIKPQALAILPALGLITLTKKFPLIAIVKATAVSLLTLTVLSFPFFGPRSLISLFELIPSMGADYKFTSLFAYNVWLPTAGMWVDDRQLFSGVSYVTWGAIIYLGIMAITVFRFFTGKSRNWYLLAALFTLAFFLFPTRVHERYLFPFLVFYLFYIATLKNVGRIATHIILLIIASTAYLVNVYYPFSYYTNNYLSLTWLENIAYGLRYLVFVAYFMLFLALAFVKKFPKTKLPKINVTINEAEPVTEKLVVSSAMKKKALIAILLFAAISRLIGLGNPPNEYFDEVYHAFTARIVTEGDPKAWEWWNPHPEGFAYEWTHPPFAKLAMAGSMFIFGQNSFAWRLPAAIFGVGVIYLVYLIGKELFRSEEIGLIAAAIMSLDGLVLVMSRIGMNDIYLLFFTLLTLYFFLKEKYFFAAFAFGLALSSKWSAVWLLPLLGIIFLAYRRRIKLSLFFFIVLPPLVYLANYIPMFVTGHDLKTWWGMQQQMWWYHTGLDAEHAYTSPAWSWPLALRPVWLYVNRVGNSVANIYAMSNPVVLWVGLFSAILAIYELVHQRRRALGIAVFGWLVFFLPWIASPRIMFFYHYLPAIPFLSLLVAYVLHKEVKALKVFLVIALVVFIYFYPHWTGILVPNSFSETYYWLPSWR